MKNIQMPTIETKRKIDGPIFRMFEKSDLQNVLELMAEIKPNIGGARYPSLYAALCREALLDKRVVLIVCEEQSEIVGFYIAIIDRNRFRISFMIRHPLIGMRMVFSRTLNRFLKLVKKASHKTKNHKTSMPDINMFISPDTSNKSWKDSSPQIAKVLFHAVAESHRGKYVGKGLVECVFKVLAERGVSRLDAIILYNNIPPIHLSYGLGFNIYKRPGSLFVTKDIP